MNYELLGEAQPREYEYDDVCGQCWGTRGKAPPLSGGEGPGDNEVSPDTSEAEDE